MTVVQRKRFGVRVLGVGISALLLSVSANAVTPVCQDEGVDQEAMTDRARGEAALAEGRAHMDGARWRAAVDAFSAAINFFGDDPANAELRVQADQGLQDAMIRLDQGEGLENVQVDQDLRAQRAMAEFDAAYTDAIELLEQNQYDQAHNTVLTANVRLQSERISLTESQFTERSERATELMTQIEAAREAHRQEQLRIQEEQMIAQRDAEERAERERRAAEIEQLLIQVRDFQMEQKYQEAMQIIERILFMDEGNPAALALRDALSTAILWQSYLFDERYREFTFAWQNQQNRQASTAPMPNFGPGDRSTTGLMVYPADWPSLSIMRTSSAGFLDNEANRRVAAALDQTIPVEFKNHRLAQVVEFLETVTNVNIQPDWKNLSCIGVEPDDTVNLSMNNIPVYTVLDHVLGQLGGDEISTPRYAIQDGLVVISSEEAIRQFVYTEVYDIRDLLFKVPYFDNAPTMDLDSVLAHGANRGLAEASRGSMGASHGARPSAGEGDGHFSGMDEFFREPEENAEESRDQLVEKIVNVLQNSVDPEGWADFGGDTGRISELNGNLVITQTPRNHQNIQGLLSQLREIRALQINIEARFLTVAMNWFEKIGFDLDLFFNTNNTAFQQAKAVDPLFHLSDFFTGGGRLKDPLIFDSFSNTNAFANQIAFGQQFGIPTGAPPTDITYITGPVGPPIRPTEGWSPINFQQDSLNLVDLLGGFGADSFAGTILATNPALSVGIQFLDDVQVDLLIQATQADRRNVILTAPRLTLFNGQRAWVLVGTQQAIVSALIPIVGDASGAFQPVLTSLTDGVVMDVEAVISADRRYVTLTIITGVREIVAIETLEFTGAAGGGGLVGGGANEFSGSISLPEVEVSLVNTSASVPDRGTLLIGGQRLIEEVEVEAGVPVFSKIPWINRFFTNRVTSKDESTLLILIRPEIIIQQENENLLFPGLSDDLGGM